MPQEQEPWARSPSDSSRARGSCLSHRPERGPQRAVISCCFRMPRRVTMTSTRGSWGTSCSKTGGHFLDPNATAAAARSHACCLRTRLGRRIEHRLGAVHHGATICGIPEVLEVLARGFAAAGQGHHTPGPAAVAAWSAEVRALAPRLWPASRRTTSRFSGRGPVFCRMVALPVGRVLIVLNVDVPDRALTAVFQAAGAALAAIYLPCPRPGDAPEYRAAIREAVGFSIKGGPHRHRAHQTSTAAWPSPRGKGRFSSPQPPGPGYICGSPRSATSHGSRSR